MVNSSSWLAICCATSPKTRGFGKSYKNSGLGPLVFAGFSAGNISYQTEQVSQTEQVGKGGLPPLVAKSLIVWVGISRVNHV